MKRLVTIGFICLMVGCSPSAHEDLHIENESADEEAVALILKEDEDKEEEEREARIRELERQAVEERELEEEVASENEEKADEPVASEAEKESQQAQPVQKQGREDQAEAKPKKHSPKEVEQEKAAKEAEEKKRAEAKKKEEAAKKKAEAEKQQKEEEKKKAEAEKNKKPETIAVTANSLEAEVIRLTNAAREKEGLPKLQQDNRLVSAARAKSMDMTKHNYFAHQSPTYGSAFDLMAYYGIGYRSAAENIASGYASAEAVVEGWMNSPGHRANMMNPDFTHIGVGQDGTYWTQMFTGN